MFVCVKQCRRGGRNGNTRKTMRRPHKKYVHNFIIVRRWRRWRRRSRRRRRQSQSHKIFISLHLHKIWNSIEEAYFTEKRNKYTNNALHPTIGDGKSWAPGCGIGAERNWIILLLAAMPMRGNMRVRGKCVQNAPKSTNYSSKFQAHSNKRSKVNTFPQRLSKIFGFSLARHVRCLPFTCSLPPPPPPHRFIGFRISSTIEEMVT